MSGVLLAHGGGVPEALTVLVPLLAVGAFLLVERGARRKAREQASDDRRDS